MCRHYRRPLVDLSYTLICSTNEKKKKKKIQNYQQRKKDIFPFDKWSNVNSKTILINRKLWKVCKMEKFRN